MPDEDTEESGISPGPLKSGAGPHIEEDVVEDVRAGVKLRGGAVNLAIAEDEALVSSTPSNLSLNVSPVGASCSKPPAKTGMSSH